MARPHRSEARWRTAIVRNVYRGDEAGRLERARALADYVHGGARSICRAPMSPRAWPISARRHPGIDHDWRRSSPIARLYDLADLSEAGYEAESIRRCRRISRGWPPGRRSRPSTASRARIELQAAGAGALFLSGRYWKPRSCRACVVTLEPVKSHIALDFARTLQLVPNVHASRTRAAPSPSTRATTMRRRKSTVSRYDLAGPLLEEFVAGDRPLSARPGVAFEPPADAQSEVSPKTPLPC